jgi:hypothetical protein
MQWHVPALVRQRSTRRVRSPQCQESRLAHGSLHQRPMQRQPPLLVSSCRTRCVRGQQGRKHIIRCASLRSKVERQPPILVDSCCSCAVRTHLIAS